MTSENNNRRCRFFRLISVTLGLILALMFFLVTGPVQAADRSYYFPRVKFEAEIHPDGSMSVVEDRTFRFDGRYRGAWEYIYLKYNASIKDVLVSEGGEPYEQMPPGTQDIAGIFYVEENPDHILIDWSFEATDEERTFTISYTVNNAVLLHQDVAELYYQFIGDKGEERIDHARVSLTLPEGAKSDDLRVWGHGPLQGNVYKEDNRVIWETNSLPRQTYLEGRVLFPLELVPEASNFSGKKGLPGILAEEERWAGKANWRRRLARVDYFGGVIVALAALVFYHLMRRRGLYHPQAYQGDYYRELPGDYSPAEAGNFFRQGRTTPEDFTATLLDLARRGSLHLGEYQAEKGLIRKRTYTDYYLYPGENREHLTDHELRVHHFIFNQVARQPGEAVSFKEIEEYAKRRKTTVAHFYRGWAETIKEQVKGLGFYGGSAWPVIIFGLVLLAAGAGLLFIGEMSIFGTASIVVALLLLLSVGKIKNLTPIGADHFAKWKAFRRFLLHFSELDRAHVPAMEIWEHYLVYAVALGVGRQVMKQLTMVYPEVQDPAFLATRATWYHLALSNPTRFDSLTTSVQQTFRTAISSSSSGSGGGGGFSGGGGGGGGGGGSGAR